MTAMLTCWDKKRNLQINYREKIKKKEKKKEQSAFKKEMASWKENVSIYTKGVKIAILSF